MPGNLSICSSSSSQMSIQEFPCFDGYYLPKQESEFVHLVLDELDGYRHRPNRKSILMFPPLPSRLRYLIHKTTEARLELATFSIGEDWCRSVVVCYSELRADVEEDGDLEGNANTCKGKAVLMAQKRGQMEKAAKRNRGVKRPDMPLYVPQAARERSSRKNQPATASDSCPQHDTAEDTKSSPVPCPEPLPDPSQNGVVGGASDSSPLWTQDENPEALPKLPVSDPFAWSFNFDQFLSLDRDAQEDVEEEELEDGEKKGKERTRLSNGTPNPATRTVATELTEEISAHLKETDGVVIERVLNDYTAFENVWINPDGFGHVIEIYDFPAFFKTDDLLDAFTEYSDGGMRITWVDNTHALGVFSSEPAALQALSIHYPLLKTRKLSRASKQSRAKATRRAEFIQPVAERPKTDSAVATRMVTRALGLQTGRGWAK